MTLPERLKRARLFLGMTQKELAKSLKTNPQTWQIYESGKSVPGGNVLEGLARLGVNINWLLTGEGEVGQRKWPVRIAKEEVGPFGRPFVISYDLDELFGARIWSLLGTGDRNLEWLANESGIDQQQIQDFMDGRAIPTVDEVVAIADALSVNPTWLVEQSPFPDEHSRHQQLAEGLESAAHVDDDVAMLNAISKEIDKQVSQYDYHLDMSKGITLSMTLFTIFGRNFCKRRDEYFEHVVQNLVKLCLPHRDQPDIVSVMGHLEKAREAIQAGDLDKARIEYMRCAKDWKQVADSGDTRFTDKLEEAQKEFTTFVESDQVYTEGAKTLSAVIKAHPGIPQFDLYRSCPEIDRKLVIYILNFMILWGMLERSPEREIRVKE